MIQAFLADNWGNIASVIGLFLTIGTMVYARRASEVAAQARDAVLSRSLADDLNHASRVASEVSIHISGAQYEAAGFRVGGLIDHTSFLVHRWARLLPEASRDNLLTARSELRAIMDVLRTKAGSQPSTKAKTDLSRACDRVSSIFHEEHGLAVKAGDIEAGTR